MFCLDDVARAGFVQTSMYTVRLVCYLMYQMRIVDFTDS